MLVQERTSWNIYGGNIASTLAGEYSFEIALALVAVRARRARVHARHGQTPWLPALLIALAVMSHIVVAIFVGVAAVLAVAGPLAAPHLADRGRGRSGRRAAHRGVVGAAARATGVHAEHALREGVLDREQVQAPVLDLHPQPGEAHDRRDRARRGPATATPTARSSRPRCGCRGGSGSSRASRSSPPAGTAAARPSC